MVIFLIPNDIISNIIRKKKKYKKFLLYKNDVYNLNYAYKRFICFF